MLSAEQEAAIRERAAEFLAERPDQPEWSSRRRGEAYFTAAYDRRALLAALDATRAENVRLTVALNDFVWLGNNLHNIALAPATFRELYEAALVDANKALERNLTCRP